MPRCEIVIVDNNPGGPASGRLQGLVANASAGRHETFLPSHRGGHPLDVRYVPFSEVSGTAAPRQHIFDVAHGEIVLVIDSHVLLIPNALDSLVEYYERNPLSRDLISGPLLYDSLGGVLTHFNDVWNHGMWGTWGCDRARFDLGEPFEIGAQGLGLFACRRAAWLGFNPQFREFGGEEWYIHEKFRRAGARCICIPQLMWQHRFGDPAAGRTSPLTLHGKVRNYVLGHRELNIRPARMIRHFVEGRNDDGSISSDGTLTKNQMSALFNHTHHYPPASLSVRD